MKCINPTSKGGDNMFYIPNRLDDKIKYKMDMMRKQKLRRS